MSEISSVAHGAPGSPFRKLPGHPRAPDTAKVAGLKKGMARPLPSTYSLWEEVEEVIQVSWKEGSWLER